VTSQDKGGIVQPPDEMIETRTATVGEIVTVMIIVGETGMTTAEKEKTIYAGTGTLIRM
jgi:hypothetical protein